MKTPGPWRAVPYELPPPILRPLYPAGTWLIVGPDSDGGQPHTVGACIPCDDGTHDDPDEPTRPEKDARAIVAAHNQMYPQPS